MKNSLKLLMVAFCTLFIAGQALSGDDLLNKYNRYVLEYIPSDSTLIRGDKRNHDAMKYGAYDCTKQGIEISKRGKPESYSQRPVIYSCYIYHSANGTSWVIRWGKAPHGPMFAEQIFQLKSGRLSLWASFNDKRENIFATKEAQKYASAHGDDTTVTKKQDEDTPAGDVINQAIKVDPADIIRKGLGTILRGF